MLFVQAYFTQSTVPFIFWICTLENSSKQLFLTYCGYGYFELDSHRQMALHEKPLSFIENMERPCNKTSYFDKTAGGSGSILFF